MEDAELEMTLVEVALSEWSEVVAEALVHTIGEALDTQERFHLTLSGGNTPRALYERLAQPDMRQAVDWQCVHLFWGDERYVPPTDPLSNYRMAYEAWLQHSAIPKENWHPMPTDCDEPTLCAQRYEQTLAQMFGGQIPQFDLILLGLGEDGHTASLFPNSPALEETQRWVAVVERPEETPRYRLTLTLPVLNASKRVWFLVVGESKQAVLERVLEGDETLPASYIEPDGELVWWIAK